VTIGVGPRAVKRLELGQISRAGERASIRLIKPHGRTPTYLEGVRAVDFMT